MSDHLARQVSFRALGRFMLVSLSAVVGLTAFGAIVVRANDDKAVLALVRGQQRTAPSTLPVARPALPASPISHDAPRGFFPIKRPAETLGRNAFPLNSPEGLQARQQQAGTRSGALVAAYAPFGGFLPANQLSDRAPRRAAGSGAGDTGAAIVSVPQFFPSGGAAQGQVTYCVRTCDGFFFPIGSGSGSDEADAAACNRLCPTAETKVYSGRSGRDIDEAQARETGVRYAAMGKAFRYRTRISKSCSCTANGYGLATDFPEFRDGSLRTGDIIMTRAGMMVFDSASFPYKEANFTPIGLSDRIDAATRDLLRKIEQASLPGKSSVFSHGPSGRNSELRDLAAASRAAETPTTLVRYVGPDRALTR